jgi:uncharacterized Tic20 family protein
MENTNTDNTSTPTSEERTLSMFSHLSVLLGGIILPIIFWATQKDKSKFVRFHSLQSIFYHIAIAVVVMLLVFILVFVMLILGLGVGFMKFAEYGEQIPILLTVSLILFYVVLMLVVFASIGYGIYLAIKAYNGNLVKIPIIGNILFKKIYGNQ